MQRTLSDRLAQRDAEAFVGRAEAIAGFEAALGGGPAPSVICVHGPGGIGKSALLREVARRAAAHGRPTFLLDGRELAPVPGELEGVFAAARAETDPVVLLDTYERVSALDGFLRRRVLPGLSAGSLVVLAGREPPAPEWFTDGWEHLTRSIALTPLSAAEGFALVRAGGIDGATADTLVAWSAGSPLALTLAIEVTVREGGWDGRGLEGRPEVVERLVRRLVGSGAEDEHAEVMAVAAIARVTTAALLAEALPTTDPNRAYAWLREQAVAEPVGDGVAMHDLVRRAIVGHLRVNQPEREVELRRRVADHLFARAAAGEPRLIVDLTELIQNPALRWGFGAEGAAELHADTLDDSELDALPPSVLARGSDEWWASTRALAGASPEHFVVARDGGGALRGFAVAVAPLTATPAALADPLVGGWVAHARENVPDGNAIVWRDSLDLTAPEAGDLGSRVLAIVNTAAVLRSGLPNPRVFYLPINPVNAASVAFARDSGSVHVPELDVRVGTMVHECHVIDFGPDGLLGAQRDTVYAEAGLPRPSRAAAVETVTIEDIRQALRDLDRPSALAGGALARAVGGAEAARALLVEATDRAFGVGMNETLMRDVIHRAYVDHRSSHESAADALHVSRTTYFRRLRLATARVSDYVLATLTTRAR